MSCTKFSVDFLLSIQPIPSTENLHQIGTTTIMPPQNYIAQFCQFPHNQQQLLQQIQQNFMQSNLYNCILNKSWANWMCIPSMLLNTQIGQNNKNQLATNVVLPSFSNPNSKGNVMTNLSKVPTKFARPIHAYEWLKRKNCRRNKKAQKRRTFSVAQTQFLEEHFKAQRYISIEYRAQISELLGLSQQQVKIWFQNRRYKMKTGKKPIDGTNGSKMEENGKNGNEKSG